MAEIPTPISVREELLATRPDTAATAMPVDKPEAVLTFPSSPTGKDTPKLHSRAQTFLSTRYQMSHADSDRLRAVLVHRLQIAPKWAWPVDVTQLRNFGTLITFERIELSASNLVQT